jgi:hypothetical protein
MFTQDQCSELEDKLRSLIVVNDSCDSDDDCVQLGGVNSENACDCSPHLGPYAASRLGDIELITETFRKLEEGSCADPDCDAAPQGSRRKLLRYRSKSTSSAGRTHRCSSRTR